MKRWALIIDDAVAETTDSDPAGRFHPSLLWVECPAETQTGWLYDGASFSAPAPVLPDYRAMIAAARYARETAGITFGGFEIDTGRDSQALITGAALAAVLDTEYSCRWKTGAGFVSLGAQEIIAVASAVRAHVQACFDREAVLLAALESDTFVASMLSEGWPA